MIENADCVAACCRCMDGGYCGVQPARLFRNVGKTGALCKSCNECFHFDENQ